MPASVLAHARPARILSVLATIALCACKADRATPPSTHQPVANVPQNRGHSPALRTLLQLPRAAYHTTPHVDGEMTYLLLDDAVYVLAPGQAPRRDPVPLGHAVAATASGFVYWHAGAMYVVPKQGGEPRRLVRVPREPQWIVAHGERFAWIDRDERGQHTVQVPGTGQPVYTLAGLPSAVAMAGDRVVVAERVAARAFRLVSVPLDGGPAVFGRERQGRSPAMLAGGEGIAYYDGNTFTVHVAAADLSSERELASDVICSPIAMADRIFCGQVEGLFVLPATGGAPVSLAPNARSMVTAIAADSRRVVFVLDVAGRLELREVRLGR